MSNTRAVKRAPASPVLKEAAVEFDLDAMTLDQIDEWEKLTGEDFDEAFAPQPILLADGSPLYNRAGEPMLRRVQKVKHLRAIIQVMNPGIPPADIGRIRLAQIAEEEPDPKEPSEPTTGPPSPPSTA